MRKEYIERLKTIKDLVESEELNKAKLDIDNLIKDMSSYKKQKHDKSYENIKRIRKESGCSIYGRDDERKKKKLNKELQKIRQTQDTDKKFAYEQYRILECWGDVLGTKWLDYMIDKALELGIDKDIIKGKEC